jgi:hypothetical protein
MVFFCIISFRPSLSQNLIVSPPPARSLPVFVLNIVPSLYLCITSLLGREKKTTIEEYKTHKSAFEEKDTRENKKKGQNLAN